MPTSRPRHFVTESDELAAALDDAATRWPGLTRPQLLVRLALEGHTVAEDASQERLSRRVANIRAQSGALTGLYDPEERERLRDEWPE